jgi:eukaryotic-like serine/threonine-protein kinase
VGGRAVSGVLPSSIHPSSRPEAFATFSEILRFSKFGGKGPLSVGASGGLGPFGTYDMAGNAKEWVWNESGEERRFVLGGAWNEATHQFRDEDARAPFERGPG